jgi:hypothetical protein
MLCDVAPPFVMEFSYCWPSKVEKQWPVQPRNGTCYEALFPWTRTPSWRDAWAVVRGCIQKFPDWVDNEIQRVMAAKLTRLTNKIAIQLHLVAESCTIFSSRSRQPVRKLLDTLSCLTRQYDGIFRLYRNTANVALTVSWYHKFRPQELGIGDV